MVFARLLGGASLQANTEAIAGPAAQRHRLALVALLTLARSRQLSRDKLVATLWPNRDSEHARGLLKQSVHTLRRALGARAILSAGDSLYINADVVASDVAAFESALAAGELERAVSFYGGPLLDGFHLPDAPEFERWVDGERDRLRRAYVEALEQLADAATEHGDPDAVVWWRRVAVEEPYSGRVTLSLMQALDSAGDRVGAIQQAQDYALLLQREFEAEPDADVVALAERLRADSGGTETSQGFAPVRPRAVKSPRSRFTGVATAAEPASPRYALVGRDAEWARLRNTWTEDASRGSHSALILGEAGIGKTRLAEELLEWAHRRGIAAARTRCYAAEGGLPYAPVADWLRSAGLQSALGMLEPTWLAELARILPEVREAYPGLQTPDVTGTWHRQRLFAALARAIHVRGEPTILLVDDLQWCDQDTLEWLHYLLRSDAGARLLVVGTARDEEVTAGHPLRTLMQELRRERKATTIELGALDADATAALGENVAGAALPSELAAELYRETEGQPLFVVESMRGRVLDLARTVTRGQVGGVSASPMSRESSLLPSAVQAVIEGRLTRLSPSARTLAGVAATLGRDFTIDVLSQACDPNDDIVGNLDELCERRIIRQQGAGRFDFSHDKLREVAYHAVGPTRRRLLHRRAAEALATVYASAPDPVSAQIAVHYEQAGAPEQAIAFYHRAARVATRICANEEAIALLERALRILNTLPENPERQRRELDLRTALCAPLRASRGWAALELAETTVRARALADRVGSVPERLGILWHQASVQVTRGDLQPALDTAREALRLASTHGDPALLAPAHFWIGNQLCQRGEFSKAREYLDQAVAHYDPGHHGRHVALFGADYGVLARAFGAHTLWHLGLSDQALAMSRRGMELAEELGHPFSRAVAVAYDATVHQFRNDPDMTRRQAEAVMALSTEYGFMYYHAWGSILKGWALAMQGHGGKGVTMLRDGIVAMRASGAEMRRSYYLLLLAEACGANGDPHEGLQLIEEALTASEANGECWKDAELHRLRGDLLLMQNENEIEAERSFRRALDIAERQEARMLELRAALSLGQLLQRRGRGRESRETMAAICAWFTEGVDSYDLLRARALLAEL